MDQELETGRIKAGAKRALGVMIDSQTGELVAIGQAPHADFNAAAGTSSDSLRNFIVETVYEPGSTFKPLIAAAAIDQGVVKAHEIIDCEGGRLRVGRHNIKDVHPFDQISFHDVIVRSSNIGMTKVGMRLGAQRLYGSIAKFGFGTASGLGFAGESRGILRTVDRWATVDVATHSFGQGIAVTPLQMVRAIASIANGGILPPLSIVKNQNSLTTERVMSERTAKIVQARKDGRGYEPGSYVASFVGFADASELGIDERFTMIVIVDEPNGESIYGGVLAAPIFRRIMHRTLAHLSTESVLGVNGAPSENAPLLRAAFQP